MTVVVLINVVLRNRLAPRSPAVELGVFDVDTCVDDVDIDALTAVLLELVLREGGGDEFGPVTDTSKTLRGERDLISYVEAGRTNVV